MYCYSVYSFQVLACEPKDAMEDVSFIQDMRVFLKLEKAIEYATNIGKNLSKYHWCGEDNSEKADDDYEFDEFVRVDYYSDKHLYGDSDIEFANFNGQVVVVRMVKMD